MRILSIAIFGLLALSCSKSVKNDATTAATTPAKSHLRPYTEKTLSNGLQVLLIEDKSLPYVSYGMVIKTGAAADPANQRGLSHFVASLLEKGSGDRTATQIADDFGQLGSSFESSVDEDYVFLSTSGISTFRDKLLTLFSQIVTSPTFADNEVERLRKQVQAHLVQRMDDPDAIASLAFRSFLFGEHPYAHSAIGNAKDVAKLQRRDLISHYLQYYRPNNAVLAVVGQYGNDIIPKLEEKFKGWKPREVKALEIPAIPGIQKIQMELVEKSDLAQTQIVLGHEGIARSNPDYLALRVANGVLGTGFSSRLVNQIRDNLGLTYSISSDFDSRKGTGPFTIATFTRHEKVGQTLSETFRLLKQFRDSGVTKSELELAKGYLAGHYLRSIETADKLAFNLLILRIYGIPDTYLSEFKANLDSINLDQVNAVVKKYFKPEQMKVVVHSTPDVLSQLKPLGEVVEKDFKDIQ